MHRSDQPNQPIGHQDLGSERRVTHPCVRQLCFASVWSAVWHTVRTPPTALSSITFAPMADLPTAAISSPRVAILTERHSGVKKTLTSVCNCKAVSFLVQGTAFLVPLPRGRFSMTHTLVPWRAREDSFLLALSSLITTINLFPFKATSSRLLQTIHGLILF